MSSNDRRAARIAIVGGGVTGLSAAFELERGLFAGSSLPGIEGVPSGAAPGEVELLLLEATGRLGGKVGTIARDGFLLESGPDSFLTRKAAAVELCVELGLTSRFIGRKPAAQRALVRRGAALYPLPEGLSGLVPADLDSLGRSPLLSAAGRARALREPDIPPRPREERDDESVAAFMSRRFGREAFDLLIEPLVSGIFAADADALSLLATYPNLRETELRHGSLVRGLSSGPAARGAEAPAGFAAVLRQGDPAAAGGTKRLLSPEDDARLEPGGAGQGHSPAAAARREATAESFPPFASFPAGMAELVQALAAALAHTRIEKGARVERLDRGDGGWRLTLGGGRVIDADAVILATPAHASAALLEAVSPELSTFLAEIPYASTAILHLAFRGDGRPGASAVTAGAPAVVIPSEPAVGLGATGAVSPADGLRGHGYLIPAAEGSPFLACTMSSRKWEGRAPAGTLLLRLYAGRAGREPLAADELRRAARVELERTLGITAEPLLSEIARWERAMPQYTLGHLERLAGIDRALQSIREQGPPLFLAGAFFRGVGIPDCIQSGREAARGALALLGLDRSAPVGGEWERRPGRAAAGVGGCRVKGGRA